MKLTKAQAQDIDKQLNALFGARTWRWTATDTVEFSLNLYGSVAIDKIRLPVGLTGITTVGSDRVVRFLKD